MPISRRCESIMRLVRLKAAKTAPPKIADGENRVELLVAFDVLYHHSYGRVVESSADRSSERAEGIAQLVEYGVLVRAGGEGQQEVVDLAFLRRDSLGGFDRGEDGGEVRLGEQSALRGYDEEVLGGENLSDIFDDDVAGEGGRTGFGKVVELAEVALEGDYVPVGVLGGESASEGGVQHIYMRAVVGYVHSYQAAGDDDSLSFHFNGSFVGKNSSLHSVLRRITVGHLLSRPPVWEAQVALRSRTRSRPPPRRASEAEFRARRNCPRRVGRGGRRCSQPRSWRRWTYRAIYSCCGGRRTVPYRRRL